MIFIRLLCWLVIFLPTGAWAQDAFKKPAPGRVWQFPADHGSHPEYKTEWWYWVGHLTSREGETFGYQLTFFRVALIRPAPEARSAWRLNTVYFAHLAISDPKLRRLHFREKAGREALGLSGAEVGHLRVWIDDWQAEQAGQAMHLQAKDEGLALDLLLTPLKPPALHGEDGFSRKAAASDAASYYYSTSRLDTRGRVALDGRTLEVNGASWMDHEFFSGAMAPGLVGWDWFALQLDDGREVMLYLLRQKDGRLDLASSGTLVDAAGKTRHLKLKDFQVKATGTWKSPHTKAVYPAGWQINITRAGLHLTLTPTLADQEVRAGAPAKVSYWEGQVKIQGQKEGKPINGLGYVELTGYAGGLGGRF
ncbi:MAG: carotenoid 1,2-hydratase [Deltaproteobacteria bacterium]|nr:carotenoid 1,2-hydratase [Deltaproteobacteria bacterium]